MALLQISEPGESTVPHQHRLAVGIDLGTTNTLVGTLQSGVVDILVDTSDNALIPSVVHYNQQNEVIVGEAAKMNLQHDPHNTITSVKRFIGRSADELTTKTELPYHFVDTGDGVPRIRTHQGDVSPIEVSSEILKIARERAEQTLGGELVGAVITVPAYFDDAQRQATKDAAQLAGISVLRLLNEPTAAAVAYGLDQQIANGTIVVYDFGGGTFDISILRLSKGVFEVLAVAGDTLLGGDDIDTCLAQWMRAQAHLDITDPHQYRLLMNEAKRAKEQLSTMFEVMVSIKYQDQVWSTCLTRDTLNELILPFIQKTLKAVRRALHDAEVMVDEITDVILVGGSTRIPCVQQAVADFFHQPPLATLDPDQVVAMGAAIQANVLAGNQSSDTALLLDVTPLSLGIETMGGLVEKIIPRNSTIPTARAQVFTTFKDGQTAISIHVLQGERELVDHCRSLARFEVTDIPPMVAGAARLQVTFQVDADGLLSVTARETTSGVTTHVEVKPAYGLGEGDIEKMLHDSLAHADEDVTIRQVKEQQVEASREIAALESALAEDAEQLLTKEEREVIQVALDELKRVSTTDDADKIRRAIEQVEHVCAGYVQKRMDINIQKALTGQRLDELE